jgi:hypothetical protein
MASDLLAAKMASDLLAAKMASDLLAAKIRFCRAGRGVER